MKVIPLSACNPLFESIVSTGDGGGEHSVTHGIQGEIFVFIHTKKLIKRFEVMESGPNNVKDTSARNFGFRREFEGKFFTQLIHQTAEQSALD